MRLEDREAESFLVAAASSLLQSPSWLCIGSRSSLCCSWERNRRGVLADRGAAAALLRVPSEKRTPGEKASSSAMGQLCCFPFSRAEEKICEKDGGEPDDAELLRLSKRLVENAVLKAVQQYLEETQNKKQPGEGSSVKTGEAERNGNDSDHNRK